MNPGGVSVTVRASAGPRLTPEGVMEDEALRTGTLGCHSTIPARLAHRHTVYGSTLTSPKAPLICAGLDSRRSTLPATDQSHGTRVDRALDVLYPPRFSLGWSAKTRRSIDLPQNVDQQKTPGLSSPGPECLRGSTLLFETENLRQ